jgi:cytochrome c-type biogenesis protein CcmH/NrfG
MQPNGPKPAHVQQLAPSGPGVLHVPHLGPEGTPPYPSPILPDTSIGRAPPCTILREEAALMAKERKTEVRTVIVRQSPVGVIIACACCLGIGLAVGYFYGKESGEAAIASSPAPAPASGAPAFLQSEMTLKSMLAANPKNLTAQVQLGNLYYDSGRYAEAVEAYGRALEIDPNNPDVRTDRGTSYWNLGQADAALAEFRKSLEIAPTHAQTLYNMGVVYLNGKNDPAQARAAWEKLLAANPNYPDRAKLQEQIAALGAPPAAAQDPAAQGRNAASPGLEDVVNRLKKKP